MSEQDRCLECGTEAEKTPIDLLINHHAFLRCVALCGESLSEEESERERRLCEEAAVYFAAVTAERDEWKRRAEVAEEVASWLTKEVLGYVPAVSIELDNGTRIEPYSLREAANMKYALAEAERGGE